MDPIRYNVKDTLSSLAFLGFNVRDASGSTTVFCFHKITKEEIWIPKDDKGFLEDTLTVLFEPAKLRFEYFQYIYSNHKNQNNPSDQN